MGAVVGGRWQLHRPLGIRLAAAHDLLGLPVVGQEVVIFGSLDEIDQIVFVGAEMHGAEVAVGDLERTPAGTIGSHGGKTVFGRLDGGDDVVAALATNAAGVAITAGQGCGAGAHQRIGIRLGADELSQHRLSHGPPVEAAVESSLDRLEMAASGEPIIGGVKCGMEPAQPLEARLQSGLRSFADQMPGFEVVEQGAGVELDELLAISGGAPLRALQAREQGWLDESRRLSQELLTLKQRKTNPLAIVEEWEKRPLPLLSDSLKRCLSDLVMLANGLRNAVIYHPGLRDDLQCLSEGIDLQMLYGFNDDLLRMDRDSSHNLNVQMQLEYIVNRWLQITRPGGH